MKIKIYQISTEKDKRNLLFMGFEFTQRHGGVDPTEYELVFEGEVEAKHLETVYYIFNTYSEMPAGYRGRSLSVSDVVVTEDGAFFCDSFGFTKLLEEFEVKEEVERMEVKSEWKVQCNYISGIGLRYIAYRVRNINEPVHSGNVEHYGEYSENKEEIQKVVDELNKV